MELGVEAADQLRAAVADMFEPSSIKQWDQVRSVGMGDGLRQQSQRVRPPDDGKADRLWASRLRLSDRQSGAE